MRTAIVPASLVVFALIACDDPNEGAASAPDGAAPAEGDAAGTDAAEGDDVGAADALDASAPNDVESADADHGDGGDRLDDGGVQPPRDAETDDDPSTLPDSFRAEATDFDCLTRWTAVRGFYLTNLLGATDEAVRVAEAGFVEAVPPGTVIQLVPLEAMVKGLPGSDPETGDWEFFMLNNSASGTIIAQRGGAEVSNGAGSCLGCHVGAGERDLVCEQTGLCAEAAVPPDVVAFLVETDPRCSD